MLYRPILGFPCGSAGKESACNAGNLGLTPGLGRSPGEGISYPLQYSCPENSREFHGLHPWGPKESDTTEWLSLFLNGNHNSLVSEDQGNWCYKHCKDDTSSCTERLSALPHPFGRPLSVLKGCGPDSTWPPDPLDSVFPHTASPSACVMMMFP